jgi:hypothetical protein
MNRWLRRGGCILILGVWLVIMCFPTFAFVLGVRGEFRIGSQDRANLRLFLVQETEAKGLGLQWTRLYAAEQGCWLTTVNYLLWQDEGSNVSQNSRFCNCFDPETGRQFSSGPCP